MNKIAFECKAIIKKSPVQLTDIYISSIQNEMDKNKSQHSLQGILLYYMNRVIQDKNNAVDYIFVEKLLNESVDVNYVDNLGENAIFKAKKSNKILNLLIIMIIFF